MGVYFHRQLDATTSEVRVSCRICGQEFIFNARTEGLKKWEAGALVQRALPELSKADRELLISNTCDGCFQKMFPVEDE